MEQSTGTPITLLAYRQERDAFFDWLENCAEQNAALNQDLTEDELLAIIEQARAEVADRPE